ncbi:hypothetical protein CLAIMM_06086 [Cladophialophora immunda]|nr:hypothetical protein CLAIMM_06086 [Cladophialophora immunda]
MTEKITQGRKKKHKVSKQPASPKDATNSLVSPATIVDFHGETPDTNPSSAEENERSIEDGQLWEDNAEQDSADVWNTTPGNDSSPSCSTPEENVWQHIPGCPITEQMCSNNVFEHYFVGQFVHSVSTARFATYPDCPQSWLLELPNFLSMELVPSVKYSIRAAALVYFAVAYGHKQAEMDAMRWYSAGLECHRTTLQHSHTKACVEIGSDGNFSNILPSDLAICVPLLFQYFETMRETTADVLSAHYNAAAEMICRRGPFECRTGIGHRIFRSLRHYEAFHSLWQNQPSRFDSLDWTTIPFTHHPKISPDFLIDILLSFCRVLQLPPGKQSQTLRDCIHNISGLGADTKCQIEKDVLVLMSRLQDWRWHFEQANDVTSKLPDSPNIIPVVSSRHERLQELSLTITSKPEIYHDTFTSYCIAIYGAAKIILHSILLVIAASNATPMGLDPISPIPRHRSAIISYSDSVLQVAMYQRLASPFCGDSVRTLSAVKVVVALAADDQQRLQARNLLSNWNFGTTARHQTPLSSST